MKKYSVLLVLLVVGLLTFVSCSTTVSSQYMVPSKIDMSNYKNLAIATVSSYPFRPFELPNPVVRDLSGTSPVRVYSGFTVNTERAMSEALTKTIVREAYDSDYFTILTPSVTDAFVNRPYMLYEQGYEALLTVYTSDVEVEEFIYAKEKEVVIPNENPALEPKVVTQLFHYLEQSVTIEFTYDLKDTKTGALLDTDSYREKRTQTTQLTFNGDSVIFAPQLTSTFNSIASKFGSSIIDDYVPHLVYRSFSLMKNSPKNRTAEKGYQEVKDGNLVNALTIFEKEWEKTKAYPISLQCSINT